MECSGCGATFEVSALEQLHQAMFCATCFSHLGNLGISQPYDVSKGDNDSPRSVSTITAFFEEEQKMQDKHKRKMKEEEEIQQMENELEDLNRTLKKEQLRKALKEAHEKKEKLCEKETEVPKPVPEKKVGS